MNTYKIQSYFINDGHNWWKDEITDISLEDAKLWLVSKDTVLKSYGKTTEFISDKELHSFSINKYSNQIVPANTYIYEIRPFTHVI